jgi:hypothetical protein
LTSARVRVISRTLRQILVPRHMLGPVTAGIRLAGQFATPVGAVAAGAATGLLGNDPRGVFAGAGALTVVTVMVAWVTGIRGQDATGLALRTD